jgi:MYXO-CTERM domain-containing protein
MSYWDGDIDGDGDVDNADIGYVAGAFTGASATGGQSLPVPEPAGLSLLALAALAVLRRRRHGKA